MIKLLLPLLLWLNPNEINIANSLDWLCYEANTIAIVKVESYQEIKENNPQGQVKVEGISLFKGEKPQLNTQYILSAWDRIGQDKWKDVIGKEILVFVKDRGCDKYCSYEMFDYDLGMMVLDQIQPKALTGDFRSLKSKNELIGYIKKSVANLEGKTAKPHYLEVPYESDAWGALWAGSSCYLIVPDVLYPDSKPELY